MDRYWDGTRARAHRGRSGREQGDIVVREAGSRVDPGNNTSDVHFGGWAWRGVARDDVELDLRRIVLLCTLDRKWSAEGPLAVRMASQH